MSSAVESGRVMMFDIVRLLYDLVRSQKTIKGWLSSRIFLITAMNRDGCEERASQKLSKQAKLAKFELRHWDIKEKRPCTIIRGARHRMPGRGV